MKILLTSVGLEGTVGKFFLNLVNKFPSQLTLTFIPTAADPYEDKWFMKKDLENLTKLGFKIKIVDLKGEPAQIQKSLELSDIIYVGGGNTFYLLDWARKSKLDKYLKNLLVQDRHFYVGASAGSILAGPDIAISGWDPEWDTNDVGLTDTMGLNLVSFVVSPHFTEKERSVLESHQVTYPVIPITDQQAIYWQAGSWQLVGDGELISLNNHG